MKHASAWILGFALTGLACLAACGSPKATPSNGPAQAQDAAAKLYAGHGIVRGFQSDGKVVELEHQAIPGLMEAMTMGFELQDPALAKGFKPGDKADFTLSVQGDDWTITAMKKL
jgi:Cu/Ag efflux protein CusF